MRWISGCSRQARSRSAHAPSAAGAAAPATRPWWPSTRPRPATGRAPAGVGVELQVETSRSSLGPTPALAPRPDEPIRRGEAWYAGDLHVHTLHSDGSVSAAAAARAAREAGLDFIAITDHNNTTHELETTDAPGLLAITGGGGHDPRRPCERVGPARVARRDRLPPRGRGLERLAPRPGAAGPGRRAREGGGAVDASDPRRDPRRTRRRDGRRPHAASHPHRAGGKRDRRHRRHAAPARGRSVRRGGGGRGSRLREEPGHARSDGRPAGEAPLSPGIPTRFARVRATQYVASRSAPRTARRSPSPTPCTSSPRIAFLGNTSNHLK